LLVAEARGGACRLPFAKAAVCASLPDCGPIPEMDVERSKEVDMNIDSFNSGATGLCQRRSRCSSRNKETPMCFQSVAAASYDLITIEEI
jgi:hypothetical protein